MPDDSAGLEQAARSENEWVRARILKRDPPAEGSLLKIAQRARDMAANSLGTQHPAYAVALQNLGLYYDAVENDAAQANELFALARAVVKENDLALADGFYWLGIFHHQVSRDAERAQAALGEALAIQRRALESDDPLLANTMIALAEATAARGDIDSAIALMRDALRIQRARAPPDAEAVAKTEGRLAMFQALASMTEDEG
ncbi:MAG TPA: tetratricopeptide repeat protein [Xanthobacteraceae bacterium]|jgi:tetratricopeptide (TPR) repeat protein|nr:tetratricopeptide repeat protein [Xanthobacteraceae bacterium]